MDEEIVKMECTFLEQDNKENMAPFCNIPDIKSMKNRNKRLEMAE
jgi:hypothetical protein